MFIVVVFLFLYLFFVFTLSLFCSLFVSYLPFPLSLIHFLPFLTVFNLVYRLPRFLFSSFSELPFSSSFSPFCLFPHALLRIALFFVCFTSSSFASFHFVLISFILFSTFCSSHLYPNQLFALPSISSASISVYKSTGTFIMSLFPYISIGKIQPRSIMLFWWWACGSSSSFLFVSEHPFLSPFR